MPHSTSYCPLNRNINSAAVLTRSNWPGYAPDGHRFQWLNGLLTKGQVLDGRPFMLAAKKSSKSLKISGLRNG